MGGELRITGQLRRGRAGNPSPHPWSALRSVRPAPDPVPDPRTAGVEKVLGTGSVGLRRTAQAGCGARGGPPNYQAGWSGAGRMHLLWPCAAGCTHLACAPCGRRAAACVRVRRAGPKPGGASQSGVIKGLTRARAAENASHPALIRFRSSPGLRWVKSFPGCQADLTFLQRKCWVPRDLQERVLSHRPGPRGRSSHFDLEGDSGSPPADRILEQTSRASPAPRTAPGAPVANRAAAAIEARGRCYIKPCAEPTRLWPSTPEVSSHEYFLGYLQGAPRRVKTSSRLTFHNRGPFRSGENATHLESYSHYQQWGQPHVCQSQEDMSRTLLRLS
ncbi:PREDICTED: uncharacterized protein LOC102028868 [Chinchilla lanigera]|uniref:uncharacterized protein LOC102028868 n=1 Tax=Chinchilla lanigera TaxID=34839 RepID=UPI00038EBDCE|nr:PREDICTED: uncharacterized protein LOC102028868 [Chinchilla lanigera]